ncbi:MAG: hypothetical protein IJ680_01390 [Paludibacteraceae bacterium]|nr:hypothetical protein [Eubacterium sp.]MBR1630486.1 hypothetical protein [Paludibacteraceae bacterium]
MYKRRIKCSDDDLEELYDLGLVASFDGCQSFSLGSCAEKCKRKLYTYLLRKFTDDEYMDEDGVFHKYPHGAEFFGATDALGSSCLSVRFPDDDITALLDEYGANRCKEWGA